MQESVAVPFGFLVPSSLESPQGLPSPVFQHEASVPRHLQPLKVWPQPTLPESSRDVCLPTVSQGAKAGGGSHSAPHLRASLDRDPTRSFLEVTCPCSRGLHSEPTHQRRWLVLLSHRRDKEMLSCQRDVLGADPLEEGVRPVLFFASLSSLHLKLPLLPRLPELCGRHCQAAFQLRLLDSLFCRNRVCHFKFVCVFPTTLGKALC